MNPYTLILSYDIRNSPDLTYTGSCGNKLVLAELTTPIEFFKCLIGTAFFVNLVISTNEYAISKSKYNIFLIIINV